MPIRQRGSRRTSNVHSPKRCYEASTRTSRALNDSLHPKFPARSQNAAVVLGNAGAARLYVIGGFSSSSNDLDDVRESGDGASWTHVNASAAARDKFPARNNHSAVAVGDTVYVIAGEWMSAVRGDVWTSGDKGQLGLRFPRVTNFPPARIMLRRPGVVPST